MRTKKGSTTFLKVLIILVGIAIAALGIFWLPGFAIDDAKAHPKTAHFLIPFLICAYGFAIAFSIALFHAFKLLTYIERNNAFSVLALKSLTVIKKCAIAVICLILLGIASLMVLARTTGEDSTGPISLSLMSIFAVSVIFAILDALQKPIKNCLETKSKD